MTFYAKRFGDCLRCQEKRDVGLCEQGACCRCCTLIHVHTLPEHEQEGRGNIAPRPLQETHQTDWPWDLRLTVSQEALWSALVQLRKEPGCIHTTPA